ncbi:hypothetical protein PPN31114_03527 [Pandoraea pneumonica]|uniref:Uncharacterized protein n=1 Tax=Pandoraea pneumonica TaxID=2508299 RepID=A0A5E4WUL1_9BURK|nr:phage regulatory CII family protein [Pandoraea pneumonica]VVE28487.1 hypothetical protein PPN31114_03527 [Pandoraea pneumonica]
MTYKYRETEPLDVLYNAVRATPGGVADAANFLSARRGRQISPESLRLRLRNEGENRISFEMFGLLVEFLDERGRVDARDAISAFAAQYGMRAVPMAQMSGDQCVSGLARDALTLGQHTGSVAAEVIAAIDDGRISLDELDAITRVVRETQGTLDGLLARARILAQQHNS